MGFQIFKCSGFNDVGVIVSIHAGPLVQFKHDHKHHADALKAFNTVLEGLCVG